MDKTALAINVFNRSAQVYQDKFMDVSLYHEALSLFCSSIPRQDAAILDIACGPGNITSYLLGQRPGYKVLGIDLAPNMIALAKANNPTAEFRLMDCRDINTLNRKFEGIICGFALPYLSRKEAIELINDAAGLLTAGGVLYISTMEADYNTSGMQVSSSGDKLYMHYHQADYLAEALVHNGFTIIDTTRKEYPGPDGAPMTDLIIIARS